jgi:hypothetical protein
MPRPPWDEIAVGTMWRSSARVALKKFRGRTGVRATAAAEDTAFMESKCWRGSASHRASEEHSSSTGVGHVGRRVDCGQRGRRTEKRRSAHSVVDVPPIISKSEFDAVAGSLKSRDPRVAVPRIVTGRDPFDRLNGLRIQRRGDDVCGPERRNLASCTNITPAQPTFAKGKIACKGRSIPMGKLDDPVTIRPPPPVPGISRFQATRTELKNLAASALRRQLYPERAAPRRIPGRKLVRSRSRRVARRLCWNSPLACRGLPVARCGKFPASPPKCRKRIAMPGNELEVSAASSICCTDSVTLATTTLRI